MKEIIEKQWIIAISNGASHKSDTIFSRDLFGIYYHINHILQVARTISRPLAAGSITPFQALVFLGLQLSVGLSILLSLNSYRYGWSARCSSLNTM